MHLLRLQHPKLGWDGTLCPLHARPMPKTTRLWGQGYFIQHDSCSGLYLVNPMLSFYRGQYYLRRLSISDLFLYPSPLLARLKAYPALCNLNIRQIYYFIITHLPLISSEKYICSTGDRSSLYLQSECSEDAYGE